MSALSTPNWLSALCHALRDAEAGGVNLHPRCPRAAASTLSGMCAIAGLGLFIDGAVRFVALRQWQLTDTAAVTTVLLGLLAQPLMLCCLAGLIWRTRVQAGRWVGLPGAFGALALLTAMNLASRDASAGSQFLVLFPLLLSAYHFHRCAALLVSGATLMCLSLLSFSTQPVGVALRSSIYTALVLGAITLVVNAFRDRHELTLRALAAQASTDPLTGLANRVAMRSHLDSALAAGEQFCLLIIDVDHFKRINDTYGHPSGDAVLIELGRRLLSVTRKGDVVARMGGDELAVMLADCSLDSAQARAAAMVERVRARCVDAPAGPVCVSISVGVADSAGLETSKAVYQAADSQLYAAKGAGRGCVAAA